MGTAIDRCLTRLGQINELFAKASVDEIRTLRAEAARLFTEFDKEIESRPPSVPDKASRPQ